MLKQFVPAVIAISFTLVSGVAFAASPSASPSSSMKKTSPAASPSSSMKHPDSMKKSPSASPSPKSLTK